MGTRSNTKVKLFALAGAALLALSLSASPALAKKKAKKLGGVVTKTAVSPTATTTATLLTATATCPKGKQAFGGGFSAPPSNNNAVIFVNESLRSGTRSWTATGSYIVLTPPGSPLALTSYVYCRTLAKAPVDVSATAPVLANNNTTPATVTPTCTGAKKLIAGGFSYQPATATSANLALVYSQFASGSAWTTSVANSGAGSARTLTGHAYCAKGLSKSPKRVTTTTSNAVAVLGQVSTAAPGCPKGTSLSGGGFASPFPTPGTPRALYLVSSKTGGNWLATALGGFSAGTLAVTSQGICT